MKPLRRVILVLLMLSLAQEAFCCSVGIASGKATKDGRPLIWKHRDSNVLDNVYIYEKGKNYNYIAVVPIGDMEGKRVLYGQNEVGFAVMNSNAPNINAEKGAPKNPKIGSLMKQGLSECRTVAEFVQMVIELKPHVYGSNYGCLDAEGNVAFVEVGKNGVHVYDANDPDIAPNGYIVRTNYAMSADSVGGGGFSRYITASSHFAEAFKNGELGWESIFSLSRSLKHGFMQTDLNDMLPADDSKQVITYFKDYVPRFSSASSVVIQGVKSDEAPILTTSWTIIASPLTTVAVPVWMTEDHSFPKCVSRNAEGRCEMIEYSNVLKSRLFPINNKEGIDYIDLAKLKNKKGTGILQKVEEAEKEIIAKGLKAQEKFRKKGRITPKEVNKYYEWLDEYVLEFYKKQM